jgi:plasmid stabilization system protein ParE
LKPQIGKMAIADLRQIHTETVGRWGQAQAERYAAAIWIAIEEISSNPERCRLRNDIHPDCRLRFVGKHAIVYRVKNDRV